MAGSNNKAVMCRRRRRGGWYYSYYWVATLFVVLLSTPHGRFGTMIGVVAQQPEENQKNVAAMVQETMERIQSNVKAAASLESEFDGATLVQSNTKTAQTSAQAQTSASAQATVNGQAAVLEAMAQAKKKATAFKNMGHPNINSINKLPHKMSWMKKLKDRMRKLQAVVASSSSQTKKPTEL
eukprot:scaffold95406_cov59-Attheya_sp.AAC.3